MAKPASIRAKLKFPSVDVFIDRYSPNISKAGIFVKTPKPKSVGTEVRFEFQIADGTVVMRGAGEVSWIRESSDDGKPTGMGIKFNKLDSNSRQILGRILDNKKNLPSEESRSKYSDAPPPPPADMDADEIQPEEVPSEVDEPDSPLETPDEVEAVPQVAQEPKKKETGSAKRTKRKRKKKAAGLDMGAIDNLLADISSDSAPRKRRRRKSKPEVSTPEPEIEEAAPEPEIEEPAPEPEVEEPVEDEPEVEEEPEPIDEEIPVAAQDPEPEEKKDMELDEEEEAALASLGSFDEYTNDIETAEEVEDEPEEAQPAFTFSEPPTELPAQPESVSFLNEEVDEDFEETLEIGEETLLEGVVDNGIESTSPVDDDLILGADEDDDSVALETLDETDTGLIGDPIDSLIDDITMDSAPPAPGKPLLVGESVDDALDDFFPGDGSRPDDEGARISVPPSPGAPDELPSDAVPDGLVRERPAQPPETLPEDAIPAGLVRDRPERRPPPIKDIYASAGRDPTGASVPVPESIVPGEADDGNKKKGFFKKLFTK